MSRILEKIIETQDAEETFQLGKDLGQQAKAGQIFCLDGELGVGKTVFTKGFAQGLGISEPVTSPTFTIIQEYQEGRLPLYHFDVYRLSDASELEALGYEEYFFGSGVTLVEWGGLVRELLPPETVFVTIEKNLEKGTGYRKITVKEN